MVLPFIVGYMLYHSDLTIALDGMVLVGLLLMGVTAGEIFYSMVLDAMLFRNLMKIGTVDY